MLPTLADTRRVPDAELLEFLGGFAGGDDWAEFFDSLPEDAAGELPEPPGAPEDDER